MLVIMIPDLASKKMRYLLQASRISDTGGREIVEMDECLEGKFRNTGVPGERWWCWLI